MKRTILTLAIIILALFFAASNAYTQVTIGSGETPNAGTLLDLKMLPDGMSTKGLMLPKVALTDNDKLYPMLPNGYASSEDANHIGLMVFHNNRCTLKGTGIYVWDGTEWTILSKVSLGGINFNRDYLDLPSGHDARTLGPQPLKVSWTGASNPTWAKSAGSLPTEITLTSPSSAAGTVGASPYSMNITPAAMATPVPTSPWQSYESVLTFTDTECGGTKTATLNQTNYALSIGGGLFASAKVLLFNPAKNYAFDVQSNAAWRTTVKDSKGILVGGKTTPTTGGTDKKDGTVDPASSISYSPKMMAEKYSTAEITIRDTATVKRFADITVSLISCYNEPTLEQWAERAGFTPAEIAAVTDADAGSSAIKNGYQLHRDQDANLFISSDFGTAGRWMIVNLAATKFADGYLLTASNGNSRYSANYYYPAERALITPDSLYNTNKQLGLTYNWAAATYGKANGGSATGEGEGQGGTPAKTQGICPNGWHLPSDREWTYLEQEISTRTSQYSSTANANATITVGQMGYRGTTHGLGMRESCPIYMSLLQADGRILSSILIDKFIGTSNNISSTQKGGFNINVYNPARTYYWTASPVGHSSYPIPTTMPAGWIRDFGMLSQTTVKRTLLDYDQFASVRCKKD
ncbi:FISUMP domain-containing protein [Dysgonomonas sp. 25]|uniref:FISUMP domain-containing protein n=1 Tax=Dysgonomonas sp. 25 TaxID=2302933 RepID=UPI0013D041D2|nr:FISUMP domain-containing protein [Dysgonomonas sp. 25]NDV68685.1 hypothetical protein [Dysgonomonas sp. 25]